MSDTNGKWPWDGGGSNEPLDVDLYGGAMSLSSDPWVQSAMTVDDMITRSRVPRELWYAPPKVERIIPQVDPDVALNLALRASWIRLRMGRPTLANTLCVTQSAIWRVEHMKLHYNEVDTWQAHLEKLNVPQPHVCTFESLMGLPTRHCRRVDTPHGARDGVEPSA